LYLRYICPAKTMVRTEANPNPSISIRKKMSLEEMYNIVKSSWAKEKFTFTIGKKIIIDM
jgi:hypothetical protein